MENIDVLDEQGNKTGEIKSRDDVHEKGLWHRTVHIWVINDNKDVLMQLRSPEKKSNPNKWTTSASGHLSAGDESRNGAVRELGEEVGINAKPEELKYVFTLKEQSTNNNMINNEIVDVYIIRRNLQINELKLQTEEVSEAKWIPYKEYKNINKDCKRNTIVSHPEMFKKLLKELENY